MFRALHITAITAHRVAFVTYASEAVFGERIDKRDVRRLVADHIEYEKELDTVREKLAHIWPD